MESRRFFGERKEFNELKIKTRNRKADGFFSERKEFNELKITIENRIADNFSVKVKNLTN